MYLSPTLLSLPHKRVQWNQGIKEENIATKAKRSLTLIMTVIIITEVNFDRVTTSVAKLLSMWGFISYLWNPKQRTPALTKCFFLAAKQRFWLYLQMRVRPLCHPQAENKQTNKQTNSIILWEHKTVFLTSPQSWQCSIIPTCSSGSLYNVLYTVFYKQQGFLNIHILWISHGWQPLAPILFIHPNIIHFDIDLSILLIA